jgi:hypothetical protein
MRLAIFGINPDRLTILLNRSCVMLALIRPHALAFSFEDDNSACTIDRQNGDRLRSGWTQFPRLF